MGNELHIGKPGSENLGNYNAGAVIPDIELVYL